MHIDRQEAEKGEELWELNQLRAQTSRIVGVQMVFKWLLVPTGNSEIKTTLCTRQGVSEANIQVWFEPDRKSHETFCMHRNLETKNK